MRKENANAASVLQSASDVKATAAGIDQYHHLPKSFNKSSTRPSRGMFGLSIDRERHFKLRTSHSVRTSHEKKAKFI